MESGWPDLRDVRGEGAQAMKIITTLDCGCSIDDSGYRYVCPTCTYYSSPKRDTTDAQIKSLQAEGTRLLLLCREKDKEIERLKAERNVQARVAGGKEEMKKTEILEGFAIVVLDRGFVYVGLATHDGEWCVIRDARNVRVWGTTEGLGQLALKGPQPNTKLDMVGTVRAPARAVIHIIDTEAKLWNCS
jgi:hypothetical protein